MIGFWVGEANAHGIRDYLRSRGEPIQDRFSVQTYDTVASAFEIPGGPQIFAGLDQITPACRSAVADLCDQLARLQPGIAVLNDPRRSLLRPELLTRLSEAGVNAFQVHRAEDAARVSRFPVFVREALEHNGSLTALLTSDAELRRALRGLRLRGFRESELLIVEFCDTSDRQGVFRKYACYKVGQSIVPAHLLAGPHWVMKSEDGKRTTEWTRQDLEFVEGNPHADSLRPVFELAGVDFGRADYGLKDGRLQVWEINTNPTMTRAFGRSPRKMEPEVAELWGKARESAHDQLRRAFLALEPRQAQPATTLRLGLPPDLLARVHREASVVRRRNKALGVLRRIYGSRVGAPVRRLIGRFLPHP